MWLSGTRLDRAEEVGRPASKQVRGKMCKNELAAPFLVHNLLYHLSNKIIHEFTTSDAKKSILASWETLCLPGIIYERFTLTKDREADLTVFHSQKLWTRLFQNDFFWGFVSKAGVGDYKNAMMHRVLSSTTDLMNILSKMKIQASLLRPSVNTVVTREFQKVMIIRVRFLQGESLKQQDD